MANLTPFEKKQYILNKYVKRDYKPDDINECKKYVVYFNVDISTTNKWDVIAVCSTMDEARQEIAWRHQYMKTNDGDLILDNDKQFETFRDETKNTDQQGVTYEPGQELMQINYTSSKNALQVLANSNTEQSKTGFKGLAYYTGIAVGNYEGYYKIEECYHVF